MNIRHIQYALEVANVGSINKTAERLYMTQPALSRAIHDLEAEIGFKIFSRTATGMVVTHQGKEFLERAKRLNEQYVSLCDQYFMPNNLSVVQISVAATQCVIFEVTLANLYNKYCDNEYVNLCMLEEDAGTVVDRLYAGLCNVGMIFTMQDSKEVLYQKCLRRNINWIELGASAIYLQVGSNHPLANRSSVSLKELDPYPRAVMVKGDVGSELNHSRIQGYEPLKIKKRIVINDKSTMYTILEDTDAYYIGANLSNLRKNNLNIRYIPIQDAKVEMEFAFLHLKSHSLTKIEKELLEDLKTILASKL